MHVPGSVLSVTLSCRPACPPVCAAIKAATSPGERRYSLSAPRITGEETRSTMSTAPRTHLLLFLISLSSRMGLSRYVEVMWIC